jgi:hypothetical protein
MINHNIEQNTDEWLALRVGKFTASIAADLLMDKGNKGYQNLIAKITEERFTKTACESKAWQGNQFTDRGHEFEPLALIDYSTKFFYDVSPMGFIESDNGLYGCSPDGLIGENGMIQVKCPIFATQRGYLENPKVPTTYYKQMQFELFVSEREYNIFYSFHPRLKEVMIKVERDEVVIKQIETAIIEATKYIDIELIKLETK